MMPHLEGMCMHFMHKLAVWEVGSWIHSILAKQMTGLYRLVMRDTFFLLQPCVPLRKDSTLN